ncbi:Suppressor of tumorigenicity 7 protein [Saguinus oedipus]|uniref:Suppressor of tumorigenicity 7 protein n=1 Tax=Saguinus oedipus TaxID=9490 RepID=A0ABQ9UI78_SAGOE|nr:Suppressor of tumorigenicity 7 protein [Saguinus oedipus]
MNRCATAYILLAEEEATTIAEAEKLFKQALKAGDGCYRRSQQLQHHGSQYEAQHRRDTNVLVYIKRRLAMCARRLGRTREAVKMMRDFIMDHIGNLVDKLISMLLSLNVEEVKDHHVGLGSEKSICNTSGNQVLLEQLL